MHIFFVTICKVSVVSPALFVTLIAVALVEKRQKADYCVAKEKHQ